jgi:hypothetical protein
MGLLYVMREAIVIVELASVLVRLIEFGGQVLRQFRRLEADATGLPATQSYLFPSCCHGFPVDLHLDAHKLAQDDRDV